TYSVVLLLGCLPLAAQGQSSGEQKAVPLPPAKHGQPAFSFEGGKRVSVQKTSTSGMQEYGAGSSAGGGTGIVEIGTGSHSAPIGTGITVVPRGGPSTGIGTGVTVVPTGPGKVAGKSALTSTTSQAAGDAGKGKKVPATTVVQILGPDGKMEYKEVPFMGE